MIFDGRTFAQKRLAVLQDVRTGYGALSLGIVVGAHDPVIESYVRIKEKTARALDIRLERYEVGSSHTTEEIVSIVERAALSHDGIIIQLPLGFDHDTRSIINAVPLSHDVDVISEAASNAFQNGSHGIMPPVASAINEILDAYDIAVSDKRVVVVGKGKLVGAPAATLFRQRGASVVVLDKHDHLMNETVEADILVLGAGSPGVLTKEMVKPGVVVFDAGTSESDGAIVGDADPAVAERASFFTPVPGGIGPVAVVEIFANLLTLKAST